MKVLTRPDGKSKGTGFVKFGWKSHYSKALELDGSDLCGRPIKVSEAQNKSTEQKGNNNFRQQGNNNRNFDQKPQGNANIETSTLFVGNISFKATPESMKRFFSQCGSVVGTRIVTDKETGRVTLLFNLESRIRIR